MGNGARVATMTYLLTDNKEGLVFLALIGSHWLAVWFGITLERDRQKFIRQTQYNLDNEQRKRGAK